MIPILNQGFGDCKLFFALHAKYFLHPLKKCAKDKTMKVNGAKIKEFRESQGLSTSDLAAKFEPAVTRQAIESWEKRGVGAFKTLNRIAKALGVSPALLLESGNGD